MGHEPRDRLAHDICLEIEAFDGDEGAAQRGRAHDPGLPLQRQPPRSGHGLGRDLVRLLRWQRRKQVHQRQRVVQIAQRIHKRRVPAKAAQGECQLFAQVTMQPNLRLKHPTAQCAGTGTQASTAGCVMHEPHNE